MDARKLLTSLFATLLLTLHAEEPGKFLIKVEPGAFTIERALQEAMLAIKGKYGKNAVLKGVNFEEGATGRERNNQVGGHRA